MSTDTQDRGAGRYVQAKARASRSCTSTTERDPKDVYDHSALRRCGVRKEGLFWNGQRLLKHVEERSRELMEKDAEPPG